MGCFLLRRKAVSFHCSYSGYYSYQQSCPPVSIKARSPDSKHCGEVFTQVLTEKGISISGRAIRISKPSISPAFKNNPQKAQVGQTTHFCEFSDPCGVKT